MPLAPGARLDGYDLIEPLGAGGMGEVWLATEIRLCRKVALKLLRPELTRDPSRVARFDEAIASSRRGRELDPLSAVPGVSLGVTLFNARRYVEAIRELRSALALHPENAPAFGFLALALTEAGHHDQAVRMAERAVALSDRSPWHLGMLARCYARRGRLADARRVADELERRRRTEYVTPAAFVYAYTGLGDRAAALAALEQAYAERANTVKFLKVSPTLDTLRGDPRFADLARRVGLD